MPRIMRAKQMNQIQFGQNKFCGPSVMSAICNITTDEAEKIINETLNKNPNNKVKGLYSDELRRAFNHLGYECKTINFPKKTTLFVANFKLQNQDGLYVFMIPGHFIAIEVNGNDRWICDNRTRSPLTLANSARLGSEVLSVFKVSRRLN